MSKWTVILKNTTGSIVAIDDLGIRLSSLEERQVSDTFTFDQLSTSADLKVLLYAGTLIVNDGSIDLSTQRGVNHVFLESYDHAENTYVSNATLTTLGHTMLTRRDEVDSHPMLAITDGDIVEYTTNKGTSGGYASLDSTGKVPYAEIPAIAISETFVVTSELEQLALNAGEGDVAIRTDENKSYIHNGGSSDTMADWYELLTTGLVDSVQARIGNVVITQADLGLENVETDILTLSGDVGVNTTNIATLSGDVDDIILDVSDNYTEHVALSAAIDTNTTNVAIVSAGLTSGLTSWLESITVAGGGIDNASIFEPNFGTHTDAIIAPLGTGSFLTDIPDGTAAGGDARGINSIDLQISRSGASQVASGNYSTIAGGQGNSATDLSCVVGGGGANTASGDRSTIAGGHANTTDGDFSTIAGGFTNTANGDYSFSVGNTTIALNSGSFVCGQFNIGTDVNTVFEVGIGTAVSSEANALEIYTDGTATLPEATVTEISSRGDASVVTKEYLDVTHTNPNLVINSNFSVNQVGYAADGVAVLAVNEYGHDMFSCRTGADSEIIYTKEPDGDITINSFENTSGVSARQVGIRYEGEELTAAVSETVTVSLYVETIDANTNVRLTGLSTEVVTTTGWVEFSGIPTSAPKLDIYRNVAISTQDTDKFRFHSLKVERGSVRTKYDVPEPIAEANRCYYYYRRITGLTVPLAYGLFLNSGIAYMSIPTGVTMSAGCIASLIDLGMRIHDVSGVSFWPDAITATDVVEGAIAISLTLFSGSPSEGPCIMHTLTGFAGIELDARY